MSTIKYVVKGNYWDDEDLIHINIYVSEILTGVKKGSIQYEFKKALIDQNFTPFVPKNFETAKEEHDIFTGNKIENNGLILDVYTNKGKDGLIFSEGEKMQVFIKTNMPCYLQLIYHLSDTGRILFLNNEFLDVSMVNKIYELPFVFICREPFGVETLQVNAREKPFPKIETTEINGLLYIDENLPSILEKSHGIGNAVLQAEEIITITTMPN